MANINNENQQFQQRVWVKEQEINALKVQNRHLIAKLEEAESNARPNTINTNHIAGEIQKQLQPVINEIQKQNQNAQAQIEKSLTQAFEMMQATLRGVYQQSQRAQQSVEALTDHSRDLELRTNESRKADQLYYQEKIFSLLVTFFERIERQLDQRLGVLSVLEHLIAKQNETLTDIGAVKVASTSAQKNAEATRNEVSRIEKTFAETNQKLLEMEVQARNSEEITRDALQQVQSHRAEFKLARGEIRTLIENTQKLNEKINLVDDQIAGSQGNLEAAAIVARNNTNQATNPGSNGIVINEVADFEVNETAESIKTEVTAHFIEATPSVEAAVAEATDEKADTKEDLVSILELLRAKKADLRRVAKDAENYLKDFQNESQTTEETTDQIIHPDSEPKI